MVEFVSGDLFNDSAEALVNTVNCVGIMGRGVALQFKKKYPGNFKAYERACRNGEVVPGRMFVYDTGLMIGPRWLINFPTKRHWKGASKIEDVSSGLDDLVRVIKERGISSVGMPPLGCGLGGLDWSVVRPLLEEKLSALGSEVRILVHEPSGAPAVVRNIPAPKMTRAVASVILLVKGYLDAMLDPIITLIEVQKLMYFLQVVGEDLQLNYRRYHYGPYAGNLRFLLRNMEGHYLRGYGDGGEQPEKPLFLLPGAFEDAQRFLEQYSDTHARIDKVLSLVHGLETPDSMELLASVHWLMAHDKITGMDEIVAAIHGWSSQKARFTRNQIGKAVNVLDKRLSMLPTLPPNP